MSNEKLKKFSDQCSDTKSIKQLNQILKNYLSTLGIKTFSLSYYTYHPKSTQKLKYEHSSEDFAAWHQHYLDENYSDVDSTLHESHQSTLPTYWNIEDQIKNAKTPRERQMRLDSKKFGARMGVSIPVHGPNDDFSNLLVVQMHDETCLENWKILQFELLSLTHFYYHFLRKLLIKEGFPETGLHLSKREIQCLTLTAQRHTVAEISVKLHIAERTVNFHLQNVNKKLGTKNKYESINKAIEKGLIVL